MNITEKYTWKNFEIIPDFNNYKTLQKVEVKKDGKLLTTHVPGLDGEISLKEDILVVTSDGQTWVYSLCREKELLLEQDIVTFNHKLYINDVDITISADACYWGVECYQFHSFILINRAELKVILYVKDGEIIINNSSRLSTQE